MGCHSHRTIYSAPKWGNIGSSRKVHFRSRSNEAISWGIRSKDIFQGRENPNRKDQATRKARLFCLSIKLNFNIQQKDSDSRPRTNFPIRIRVTRKIMM